MPAIMTGTLFEIICWGTQQMSKHYKPIAVLAPMAAVIAGPAAAQDAPAQLQPSGPWVADFAENHCALRRDFGVEGGERMLIEFRQYRPGNTLDLLLGSDSFRATEDAPQVAFLPGEANELGRARSLEAPGGIEGFSGVTTLRPPAVEGDPDFVGDSILVREDDSSRGVGSSEWSAEERSAREASITAVRIAAGFDWEVVLDTGPLAEAMNAMRVCMADLMQSRGLDPDAPVSALSRDAQPVNLARWARRLQEDYPHSALMSGQQATLRVLLQIDEKGRVSECDVQTDIDPEIFRHTACQRMYRYARFEPALDHEGNPTNGFWSTTVTYQIR